MRVRLLDLGRDHLVQFRDVFELPEEFVKLTAFSFSVHLALNPGEEILDVERAAKAIRDLTEEATDIYIRKRGDVKQLEEDRQSIPVEVKN